MHLSAARLQLEQADLIAYRQPSYQVLSLESGVPIVASSQPRTGQTQSAAEALKRILQGGGQ